MLQPSVVLGLTLDNRPLLYLGQQHQHHPASQITQNYSFFHEMNSTDQRVGQKQSQLIDAYQEHLQKFNKFASFCE